MKTKNIRGTSDSQGSLDAFDRKILSTLVEDASQTLTEIGKQVNLSPPAVHERIKRMRASGTIATTTASLDGHAIGKPLLVFIHVQTAGWGHTEKLKRLSEFPEFEEVHSVTGETSMILKVRLENTDALESVLRHLHAMKSVVSTKTFVTLSTYLDRPIQAEVTEHWPDQPIPPE